MENPDTWDEAVKVIDRAITAATRASLAGTYGWSMAKQVAHALDEENLLASEQLRTKVEALDAYAQQNADLHRENMRLIDENTALAEALRKSH